MIFIHLMSILPTEEIVKTYRVEGSVWGTQRTLIVYISETLRQGQERGLRQWMKKRTKALDQMRQELQNPKAKPREMCFVLSKIRFTTRFDRNIIGPIRKFVCIFIV
jgi:hypothetical protein